ncbi:MAG: aminopeptidase P family protein [Candidatus Aminicenantes bacterium]|nr:MAG: aminopeptidase P family protein [Candidatus Aminicenantes bacterium]
MEKEKVSQAIDILNETGTDLWMVIDKESEVLSDPIMDFIIGTGVTWLSFFLFFKTGEKYAIVGNLDIEKIKRLEIFDEIFPYKGSPRDDLLKLLNRHSPQKIAINYSIDSPTADGLTYGKYLKLLELLEGTDFKEQLVSAEDITAKLRGRKSPEEVRRIKKAIEITLDIYDKVTTHVKPGMTEKEVAQFITNERKKVGFEPAWEEDHCPSVFAGPQETGAHSGPTDKKLERGHVFNTDFGVVYEKYCSDLQRTWYILPEGETEPPEEVMKGFDTIVKSIQLAFEALKPGVRGFDIDKIARDYIVSQGYKAYEHALGHQVGRSAHDGAALLGPDWERYGKLPFIPLEEGQVFTIEPRLYLDQGVVTIEEMVVITKDGAEWLSEPQREIYLIK